MQTVIFIGLNYIQDEVITQVQKGERVLGATSEFCLYRIQFKKLVLGSKSQRIDLVSIVGPRVHILATLPVTWRLSELDLGSSANFAVYRLGGLQITTCL